MNVRSRRSRTIATTVGVATMLTIGCADTPDAPAAPVDAPAERPAEPATDAPEEPARDAAGPTARPEGFPAELPLPDGGVLTMRFSDATAMHHEGNPSGESYFFEWSAEHTSLREEMESRLVAEGWTIEETQTGVAVLDDISWLVSGHGRQAAIEVSPFDDGGASIAYLIVE